MNATLLSSALVRPFVPAKDFGVSKRLYRALGFEQTHDGEVAIFQIGTTSFILQNYYNKEWAENFMMQCMVDDIDAWWSHLSSLSLEKAFSVPSPKAPEVQPWGLRVSYVVDPSGVLWHFAQRRPNAPQDV